MDRKNHGKGKGASAGSRMSGMEVDERTKRYECEKNRFLRIFTCNAEPKSSTFKRFLEESDRIVIKKIFIV